MITYPVCNNLNRSFVQKYKRMLGKQMLTESEAYIIAFMTTLNVFKNEIYEKTTHEIHNVISTYINNIIERYSSNFLKKKSIFVIILKL